MAHSPEVIQELTDKTKVIRRNILRIFESSRMGHCGGTMSLVEIVNRALLPSPEAGPQEL